MIQSRQQLILIMISMVQNNKEAWEKVMSEKLYKNVNNVGITNLVLGICLIAVAVGIGVSMIVGGAKLIKSKSSILL